MATGDRDGAIHWVRPDWTFPPLPGPALPGPLPARGPVVPLIPGDAVKVSASAPAPAACDCGAKLAGLLKVLSLPEGLRGLVLALAAAPDADAIDVLADYLEERTDPRTGRFRGLARRAREGATP